MIDLVLNLYFNEPANISYIANKAPIVDCNSKLYKPVVCSIRREQDKETKRFKYYIRLTGQTQEFLVNRCTYLGNKLNEPFIFIQDTGRWCKIEK